MIIENIRYGFACNSSSSHSVVLHGKNDYARDTAYDGDGCFGWESFILKSKEAKQEYLKVLINARLGGGATGEMIANKYFPDVGKYFSDYTYIDHQSVPLIPRKYGSKDPCYAFFEDLVTYVERDGVVIYGGNDNGDALPPKSNIEWYKCLPQDEIDNEWIARKEKDWWVLFDTRTGCKVTLSFKDDPEPRLKAIVPELVDLKITNRCPYECYYCYQNSRKDGDHARDAEHWLYVLHNMEVFEVAIGGGEPTCYPNFSKFLQRFKSFDIKLNFSTRNFAWLIENSALIKQTCGAVALSVDSVDGLTNRMEQLKSFGMLDKITLQYVMGTASSTVFKRIVETAEVYGVQVTLLGYKNVGRGKNTNRLHGAFQYTNEWVDWILKKDCCVAIDTALAATVPEGAFKSWRIRRLEGTHSMYIDAVRGLAGASSYCDKLVGVDPTKESILDVFHSF